MSYMLHSILYNKETPLELDLSVVTDGGLLVCSNDDFAFKRDVVNQLYGRLIGIVAPGNETRVIVHADRL
jgi:hypothetical protein